MKLEWVYREFGGRQSWLLFTDTVWSGWVITRGKQKYSVRIWRQKSLHYDMEPATPKTSKSLSEAKTYAEVCYRMGVHK